jgi:23S rRNA-/tRNA-specific pseudouridylate synthase
MSSIGHALAGDKLYGKKGEIAFEDGEALSRHFLHAEKLSFKSSEGKKIEIEAPLPDELKRILEHLESAD